jgi:hypothetical protein
MAINFETAMEGAVRVLAGLSRVQHSFSFHNIAFRILCDGEVIAETNTGDSFGWNYAAISFEGVRTKLAAGSHNASVEYKTANGTVYFANSNSTGSQARHLAVVAVQDHELTTESWSEAGTADSTTWAPLPTPMSLPFTTFHSAPVVVTAGLSRVQHDLWSQNTAFRIVVVGDHLRTVIAEQNTADAYSWSYAAPSFHGVFYGAAHCTYDPLEPVLCQNNTPGVGSYTAVVEYKTTGGNVSFWGDPTSYSSSGNQMRRLTVHETGSSSWLAADSWSDEMEGGSESWAPLPQRMRVNFTISETDGAALVMADISRVQHDTYGLNTAFRIVINGTTIAETNTGSAADTDYAAVSFQGVRNQMEPGLYEAEVEYRTMNGTVGFWGNLSDDFGGQARRLTVHVLRANLCSPPVAPPPLLPPAAPLNECLEHMWTSSWDSETEGESNAWAQLPIPMHQAFIVTEPGMIAVTADLSSVQHERADASVAFRLVLDGEPMAQIEFGTSENMRFATPSLHGVWEVDQLGHEYMAHVEYRTSSGFVSFTGGVDRANERRLTVQWSPQNVVTSANWTGELDLSAPPPPPSAQPAAPPSLPPSAPPSALANTTNASAAWASFPGAMTADFTLNSSGSVVVIAQLSTVVLDTPDANVAFRIVVSSTAAEEVEVAETNVGSASGSDQRGVSFRGAAGLAAGTYTAEVQFKIAQGASARLFDGELTTQERRLSVHLAPQQNVLTQAWSGSQIASGPTWASIDQIDPMKIDFVLASATPVIVMADLSRVQHSAKDQNVWFRIVVDDSKVLAVTNTGDAAGVGFAALSFHGVARPHELAVGAHSAEVQFRTDLGSVGFLDGTEGAQARRIAVMLSLSPGSSSDLTSASFSDAIQNASAFTWSRLPTPFYVNFQLKLSSSVVVLVDLSHIEHFAADQSTKFRIRIDNTSTIGGTVWDGASATDSGVGLSFHGAALALTPGLHTAEVEYQTDTANESLRLSGGLQARRISVVTALPDMVDSTASFSGIPSFPFGPDGQGGMTAPNWQEYKHWHVLPIPMRIEFYSNDGPSKGGAVIVLADLAGLQGSSPSFATRFRLSVDGIIVASTDVMAPPAMDWCPRLCTAC